MLLTIFNLPATTRYGDIKSLIHSKCGFKEVILDNLTSDSNNTKKVTVGLAEEEDAAILVRKINGLLVDGQQLYVEAIKKKKQPNNQDDLYTQQLQPSYNMGNQNMQPKKPAGLSSMNQSGSQLPTLQQPYYQQSYQQPSYQLGYSDMQQNGPAGMASSMSYAAMSYDTSRNAFANYGYPQQMPFQSSQMVTQSMVSYDHTAPLGFGNQDNSNTVWSDQNDWNSAGNVSGGNKVSQQNKNITRWDTPVDSNTHSRRDAPSRDAPSRDQVRDVPGRDRGRDGSARDYGRDGTSRDFGRDANSRNYGRDAPSRDFGRDGTSRDFGRDGTSRDFGRDANSRNFGRDAPSRDLGRNASTREEREGPSRNNGRDALSRDRGRDAPRNQERGVSFRDRGRDAPARDRNRDARDSRELNRDWLPNRRNEPNRAPQKRQYPAYDAPNLPKSSISHPKIYGDHVTDPPPLMSKLSQKPDGRKTNQLWSKMQSKPTLNNTWNAPNSEGPSAKRQRKGIGANVSGKNQSQTSSKAKIAPNINSQKTIDRAATWRQQVASSLGKEILNNPTHKSDLDSVKLLKELKKSIRTRLEKVLGDDLDIKMTDMLLLYRKTYDFDSDTKLFKEVTEAMEKNGLEIADVTQKATPNNDKEKEGQKQVQSAHAKPAQVKPAQVKPAQAKPAQAKPAQTKLAQAKPAQAKPGQTTKKLPSYPEGDKMFNKELKKRDAMVFQSEDTLLSQIEPNMQKALNEETDEMCARIVEEFQDEPEPDSKMLHERVKTAVVDEIKKMVKVNFAKRILNTGPIMVRIFSMPKMVNKTILSHVLADYGVKSLRKSERKKPPVYYGTCDTYEEYDKLCSMEPLIVSGCTVTIKPFHLTGKDKKITRDQILAHRQNIMKSFENMGEDQDMGKNDEDYNQHLNNDQNEEDDDQGEYECAESMEQQDIENGANEVEKTDTKANDTTENTESTDAVEVDTQGGNEDTDNTDNDAAKEFNKLTSEVEEENNIEVNSTEETGDKLEENEEDNDNDFTTDFDFTETSNKKRAFKIDGGDIDIEADKNLSQLNPEDLVDFNRRKNYEDIDIADLNDDDLEDW